MVKRVKISVHQHIFIKMYMFNLLKLRNVFNLYKSVSYFYHKIFTNFKFILLYNCPYHAIKIVF